MDYTRREFLETMSGATALAGVSCMPAPQTGDDPLGVREDFPVVEQGDINIRLLLQAQTYSLDGLRIRV